MAVRDVYRFATSGAEGMHRELIERYIQVQAQLLVPITPHTSEHIWSQMLKRPGSVLNSGWPKAEEPDFVMQRASQYIEELIPSLRKMIQKSEAPPREKKGGKGPATPQVSPPPPPLPPRHCPPPLLLVISEVESISLFALSMRSTFSLMAVMKKPMALSRAKKNALF